MFVLTVDQVGSRHDHDRVRDALDQVSATFGARLALPADRSAGDELQALTGDAASALGIVLSLTRSGHWSVGLGVGTVQEPLPATVREAAGPAFVAARGAVEAAKRAPQRFWLSAERPGHLADDDVRALVNLVLAVRARRSDEGWEVVDLVGEGLNQAAIAARLGISRQAVSLRLAAAQWRLEEAAIPGLVLLLEDLDRGRSGSTARPSGAA